MEQTKQIPKMQQNRIVSFGSNQVKWRCDHTQTLMIHRDRFITQIPNRTATPQQSTLHICPYCMTHTHTQFNTYCLTRQISIGGVLWASCCRLSPFLSFTNKHKQTVCLHILTLFKVFLKNGALTNDIKFTVTDALVKKPNTLFHWTHLFSFFHSLIILLAVSHDQCSKGSWAGIISSQCSMLWVTNVEICWFRDTKSVFISNRSLVLCHFRIIVFVLRAWTSASNVFLGMKCPPKTMVPHLFFHLFKMFLVYIMIQSLWTHDHFLGFT